MATVAQGDFPRKKRCNSKVHCATCPTVSVGLPIVFDIALFNLTMSAEAGRGAPSVIAAEGAIYFFSSKILQKVEKLLPL